VNERRGFQPAILSRAAFSPDGRWVATACFDAVTLHDTVTWQGSLRLPRDSASDLPGLAAFSPDGRMLAFTPHLRRIQLVEPVTGRELATLTAPDLRMLTDLFFSGDGRLLGGLTSDNVVQLWDLAELRRQLVPLGLDWASH
jgi:WD40 repeat protein